MFRIESGLFELQRSVLVYFRRWILGKPFSLDLRRRILVFRLVRKPYRSAGKVLGVSAVTAVRYDADCRKCGEAITKPHDGSAGQCSKLATFIGFLTELMQAEPDIVL